MKQKNPIMDGSSGRLGQAVFRQTRDGRTLIGRAPKVSEIAPTEDQLVVQDKFRDAAAFAKGQMANPDFRAMYAARVSPKFPSPYSVAMADGLKSPKVREIDAFAYRGVPGDQIRIKAVDDFAVATVEVSVRLADGTALENGYAVQDPFNSQIWIYTVTVANPIVAGTVIHAKAKDRPNNSHALEVTL